MHIRVSMISVWCIRVSRGLAASATSRSWKAMSASLTAATSLRLAARAIVCTAASSSVAAAPASRSRISCMAACSTAVRARYKSRTSDGVISTTNTPRLRISARSPSWVSRWMPSRSGPRLTPSSLASSASTSWTPGGSSPEPIAMRSFWAMRLAVDCWATGVIADRFGPAFLMPRPGTAPPRLM
jgi:hypothetical protein